MKKMINFRTKFLQDLKEEDIARVEAAFRNFVQLDPNDALEYLWRITYEGDEAANKVMKELCLSGVQVDRIKMRNELRHQYGEAITLKKTEESFKEMEKKSDSIIASVLWNACNFKANVMDKEEADRVLFLLIADRETFNYGAIRELGFNAEEAAYLKQYHKEIYELFKSIRAEKSQIFGNQMNEAINSVWTPKEDGEQDTPTVSQETEVEQPTEVPEASEEEETLEPQKEQNNTFYSITAEEVFKHRDIFESFISTGDINSFQAISKSGYDLNEALRKREAIGELLNAAKNLED